MINIYKIKPSHLCWLFRLWPPLWFTGIRFTHISDDFRELTISMPLRFYNRNLVGVHFGGSLFSMSDPCYMLMMMYNLGPDYYVWDKAASIDFVRPGKGRVTGTFILTEDDIADARANTHSGNKFFKTLPINLVDDNGEIVCSVQRTLYIKKKT